MARNIFTRIPERGDVCIGRRADKKIFYITAESYDPSGIDQTVYENQGVVFLRDDEGAHIVGLSSASKPWCSRQWHYISGQQLDGEEHTATFNIRTASADNWKTVVAKTFTYKATTDEALVEQLRAFFQADKDMKAQDWWADITQDGKVRVHFACKSEMQLNNNTSTGLVLGMPMPEVGVVNPFGLRKTGRTTEGSISNLARAVLYYKTDRAATEWAGGGVNKEQPLRPSGYPIGLPSYLGQSAKNPGDFCKTLRSYYGEGEEGWMNYMRAQMYHYPANRHDSSAAMSLACTLDLARHTYTSVSVTTPTVCLPAAAYCAQYATGCTPAGQWYLGDAAEIAALLDGVEYGANPSRQSDILNKSLSLMDGTGVGNVQYLWSCVRAYRHAAWCALGNLGFFIGGYLQNGYLAVPLSLQQIKN